ncbi:MAG: response regulator [Arenibacterium sp.]
MSMLAGYTILVADDEFLIALILKTLLSKAGAQVHIAATVEEAITVVEAGVDAALLDVSLADGEVFPAADRLAELQLPFVFHSGHALSDELLKRYPQAHAVTKPAPNQVLLASLKDALS